MSDDTIIRVKGLWKRYGLPLPESYYQGIRWLHSLRNQSNAKLDNHKSELDEGPWALREVNFEVKRGETVGIIGRNGAGKSTLLKVIAAVTPLTRGKVEVSGRVFPMIELNAGLHQELTGRENVFLLGAIMGLRRPEVLAKLPGIEDFCELAEWFDRPVRMYSSGMLARLGFGVAVSVGADIILIDEVLAVGDIGFQRKCFQRLHELQGQDKTILLVSHNPYAIERHCTAAMIMDAGTVTCFSSPSQIFYDYFASFEEDALGRIKRVSNTSFSRPGGGQLRISGVQILDDELHEVEAVYVGQTITFRIQFLCNEAINSPNFGLQIQTLDSLIVASVETTAVRHELIIHKNGYLDCRLPLNLTPNSYTIRIKVAQDGLVDLVENAIQFRVLPNQTSAFDTGNMGLIYLRPQWNLIQ